ncbi:M23 family metallopeptidase [Actinopolymorpha singaporensis]|uniref:Peptidase family M23 n=1 Tax=Actinopolymorpha singaporensis TaxID=117157 RepID=A0A1H1NES9_9ACTN|nr:M23 family metallopeptidase [Actinopolymorpha singaporensis]SDR97481.1 Peptidase family M23 [Actinopolymorpha singaporensis]
MPAPVVVAARTAGRRLARAAATRVGRRAADSAVRRGTGGRLGRAPHRRTLYVGLGLAVLLLPVLMVGLVGSLGLALFAPLGSTDTETSMQCGPTGVLAAPDTSGAGPGSGSHVGVVAGDPSELHADQIANTKSIIAAGKQSQVPEYGWVVALATALQESGLHNLTYGDRDSVGLFQQRSGWGSYADRTNPMVSATMFYTGGHGGQPGLLDIRGWQNMTVTDAAQAVQVSAFPSAYADDEPLARALVAKYGGGGEAPGDCGFPPGTTCPPTPWPASEAGLTPDALKVIRCLHQQFPQFTTMYGVGERPAGGDGDHAHGRAVDAMLPFPDYKSQPAKAFGWQVANWVRANQARLGVHYVIFDKKIWSINRDKEGWRDYTHYAGCTSDTCLHYDHVHVSVFGNAATLPATGAWVLPVAPGSYHLTARFGQCSAHWANCHTGLDFAAPTGTPIRAAAAGTVIFAGRNGAYGNMIKIDNGNGVQTMYAHQSRFAPNVLGAHVIPGQMIGEVGSTGNTTGPHLHFEVRVNGQLQDPEVWLSGHGVPP